MSVKRLIQLFEMEKESINPKIIEEIEIGHGVDRLVYYFEEQADMASKTEKKEPFPPKVIVRKTMEDLPDCPGRVYYWHVDFDKYEKDRFRGLIAYIPKDFHTNYETLEDCWEND